MIIVQHHVLHILVACLYLNPLLCQLFSLAIRSPLLSELNCAITGMLYQDLGSSGAYVPQQQPKAAGNSCHQQPTPAPNLQQQAAYLQSPDISQQQFYISNQSVQQAPYATSQLVYTGVQPYIQQSQNIQTEMFPSSEQYSVGPAVYAPDNQDYHQSKDLQQTVVLYGNQPQMMVTHPNGLVTYLPLVPVYPELLGLQPQPGGRADEAAPILATPRGRKQSTNHKVSLRH